jgi:cell division protease FtsH
VEDSRARITSTLGGRAAEQLVYGVVTSGTENDLQHVTDIARHIVLRWGMSEKLGPISFVASRDEGLPAAYQQQPYSEATSELIDAGDSGRHRPDRVPTENASRLGSFHVVSERVPGPSFGGRALKALGRSEPCELHIASR